MKVSLEIEWNSPNKNLYGFVIGDAIERTARLLYNNSADSLSDHKVVNYEGEVIGTIIFSKE